jgi:hypothetical protein
MAAEEELPGGSAIGSRLRRIARWSWPQGFPIVQFPNPPLALALLASIAAGFTEDTAHRSQRAVFYLALGVWAYDEARDGDNWFRRALGTGFSIYLIVSLAAALRS